MKDSKVAESNGYVLLEVLGPHGQPINYKIIRPAPHSPLLFRLSEKSEALKELERISGQKS